MQKINIEVEAYTIRELFWTENGLSSRREMQRLYGQDRLKILADAVISDSERYCHEMLNTSIEVEITVGKYPHFSFEVEVRIVAVGANPLPKDCNNPRLNKCVYIQTAASTVEDIQLFSKVINKLKSVDEHRPAQGELEDLVDIRTRELTYELVQSITKTFSEKVDTIHKDHWAEEQAVKSGALFDSEGKVISGYADFDQERTVWNT
jgi:hypothetical protein